ncbi:MAG TPA: L-aspartate oxidase [Acidimicrobiales bacterium]|nr:L-aspartate oxidase [Acidimicrobiales bacterium]
MRDEGRFVSGVELAGASTLECDVAIFGSGIAGLTVACALPDTFRTLVFSKGPYGEGSTPYAQGGIAAAVGPDDDPSIHASDTLVAAVGIADPEAVSTLAIEAPDAIAFLEKMGTVFDRSMGHLALTLEGGHSRRRIVHAGGDATGAEISRSLFRSAESRNISILNEAFLVDLLLDQHGQASGAIVLIAGDLCIVRFSSAVLASGGAGQLFSATTSPASCTGDGMAAAFRAGAELADMEFVQFHPTVLVSDRDPRPLISEALRGEGAVLRDAEGNLVMEGVHPQGDLAPRDIVSRRMVELMHTQGVDRLYLDARRIAAMMPSRFPTISASLRAIGLDPALDQIPVSPASHYSIGGIRTTIDGMTSIDRLYSVGEAASVGIHGANRLASNSLLEGVVFGRRIAQHISGMDRRTTKPVFGEAPGQIEDPISDVHEISVRCAMDLHAGVVRERAGLDLLLAQLEEKTWGRVECEQRSIERANMLQLSKLIVRSAISREESRGAHYRRDTPNTEKRWEIRQVVSRVEGGEPKVRALAVNQTVR